MYVDKFESIVLRWMVIILVPALLGTMLVVKDLSTQQKNADPEFNGYVAPSNLGDWIDLARERTVTVSCNEIAGSGFSFDFLPVDKARWSFKRSEETESILLTNYHVIEPCLQAKKLVKIYLDEKKVLEAEIAAFDSARDIAALSIKRKIDPLYSIYYKPYSGYWVMAVGSPFAMDGTTTFGNIINLEDDKIFTSASLNKGNSGGPLVDNEGLVVGMNTGYRAVAQNVNWAIDINALCYKIAICESDTGLLHPIK